VLSDVHLGDWGLQMGQLISELGIRQPFLPYFDAAFAGPYPDAPPVTLADHPAAARTRCCRGRSGCWASTCRSECEDFPAAC
jgi:hypothetical protein